MRTVLIVSPHFPPSTLAGVHRARHLANHLTRHGWRPIVVRVDERDYEERADPALAGLVSPDVLQVRVRALRAEGARRLGVGDVGIRAYGSIRAALKRLAEDHSPSAVLITGAPFYPMLLAGYVRRRLNLPVVLDFQDPWIDADGDRRPRFSKSGLSHRLATILQPRAVRSASFITSVSEIQNDDLVARYPWLDRAGMAAIPIGGDPEDFERMRVLRDAKAAPAPLLGGTVTLSYVGACLPRAKPLLTVLFRALAQLRTDHPTVAQNLRLNFVGTSNQPDHTGAGPVAPLASALGVGDMIYESPQRAPYLDALSILDRSQGILMIGSDEPHYTASKIYPGLMSGRPFLSLFHQQSSAHAILSAAGGGLALAFGDQAELDALQGALAEALLRLATRPDGLGAADPSVFAPFTADAVARRFADVFDRVSDQAA